MPPAVTLLIVALIVALGLASAFFSAAETAMFALRGPEIDAVKSARPRDGELMAGFLAQPRRLLGMLVIGDVFVNIPLCLLCLLLLETEVPAVFSREVPKWAAAPILFAIVIGACDLFPKLVALKRPQPVARHAVGVLRWLSPVLGPLADALNFISERLADALTPARWRASAPLTPEEMEAFAQLAAEAGILRGAEGPVIGELLKLRDKTSKDVMTPRVDAFALTDDLPAPDAARRVRAGGRRYVPVYGDTPDDILGVLDAQEFLLHPEGDLYVERLLPPSFVPETMPALTLLRSFLTHKQHLAIVVDEYGGYEGIVTPADLVEEILADALPGGVEEPNIEHDEEGRVLASGQARLDDLAELFGVPLETEGLDTLSGLISNRLGLIPRAGAQLELPGGLHLTILRASRRRVELVRIERREPEVE